MFFFGAGMATNRGGRNEPPGFSGTRDGRQVGTVFGAQVGRTGRPTPLPSSQAVILRQGGPGFAPPPLLTDAARTVLELLRGDQQTRSAVMQQLSHDNDAETRDLSGRLQVIKYNHMRS
jgi:hypothetical protein